MYVRAGDRVTGQRKRICSVCEHATKASVKVEEVYEMGIKQALPSWRGHSYVYHVTKVSTHPSMMTLHASTNHDRNAALADCSPLTT